MFQQTPRILLTTLAIMTLLTAAISPPAAALDQAGDGITAHITMPGSIGDLVLLQDENGDYAATVSIYQQNDGEWQPIELRASLRVFEDNIDGAIDRVSIPFWSSTEGPVTITFPGDSFTGGPLDVFVTFSALGPGPEGSTPTSHHHIVKNLAIELGQYELADSFDHHNTRVIAL